MSEEYDSPIDDILTIPYSADKPTSDQARDCQRAYSWMYDNEHLNKIFFAKSSSTLNHCTTYQENQMSNQTLFKLKKTPGGRRLFEYMAAILERTENGQRKGVSFE